MGRDASCRDCNQLWDNLKQTTMALAKAEDLFDRAVLMRGVQTIEKARESLASAELHRNNSRSTYRQHKRDVHGEDVVINGSAGKGASDGG